jgi:hypothetical protein
MIKFSAVYENFSQALDGFPSDELEISDELKEQVYIICQFPCEKFS